MMNQPGIIHRVMFEDDYSQLPPLDKQKEWLTENGDKLKALDDVKAISIMAQCKILYYVNLHWEKIDEGIKGHWQKDFYVWAASYTQSESITAPASSTIDNKINVYKDYFAERTFYIPSEVLIRKTNDFGQLVGDGESESDWVWIKPDLMWGNFTKLLHARTPAKEGKMTPELWGSVFDPHQSVRVFLGKVNGSDPEKVKVYEEDGIFYARNSTGKALLGALDFEDSESPIWVEGVRELLRNYEHSLTI